MRPEELKYLKGDSTKIRETLGWKPEYTFETLMDDMVDSWDEIISKRNNNMIKKATNSVSKTGTTKTTKDKRMTTIFKCQNLKVL
jgi:dTDP-D-glucose 4,6-dehydratase